MWLPTNKRLCSGALPNVAGTVPCWGETMRDDPLVSSLCSVRCRRFVNICSPSRCFSSAHARAGGTPRLRPGCDCRGGSVRGRAISQTVANGAALGALPAPCGLPLLHAYRVRANTAHLRNRASSGARRYRPLRGGSVFPCALTDAPLHHAAAAISGCLLKKRFNAGQTSSLEVIFTTTTRGSSGNASVIACPNGANPPELPHKSLAISP